MERGSSADSQSSEPGFESPFATVSNIGHFRSLHWRPCRLSCINEYLAIDSGGNVSDLVFARNCCMVRTLPGEAKLVPEWTCLPGREKRVQRFERSNGLDTALYQTFHWGWLLAFEHCVVIARTQKHTDRQRHKPIILKMVWADLVRVVQLLCSFRAKITWPSVYVPFLGPVKT